MTRFTNNYCEIFYAFLFDGTFDIMFLREAHKVTNKLLTARN